MRKFAKEIMKLNPDTVIFNSIVTCISAGFIPKSVKKIAFVRETFNRTFIDRIYKKIFEDHFDGVCFIAKSESEYINLKNPTTTVIPDCLAPKEILILSKKEACNIERLDKEKFNILFLGGIEYIKGADIILKAISLLNDDYHLIVAGYFDEKQLSFKSLLKHWYSPRLLMNRLKIRIFYKKLNKRKQITCIGFKNDISSLMCSSDVVVFPSNKAHQSRPGIEAGEYMKTVIISDYEATREYFTNGYNAITFKPRNSKDLRNKIKYLNENHTLLNELGKNNYKMTRSKHDYYMTQIKLRDYLNKIINGKSQEGRQKNGGDQNV